MQEKTEEQGATYILMPKDRDFTPHFDNLFSSHALSPLIQF